MNNFQDNYKNDWIKYIYTYIFVGIVSSAKRSLTDYVFHNYKKQRNSLGKHNTKPIASTHFA